MNSDKHENDNIDIDDCSQEHSDDSEMDLDVPVGTFTSEDNPEMPYHTEFSVIQQSLAALQDSFEKQIARNQNQTEMFDKIYAEMKDYKESFLLEVLHKPIIHNIIQLYDSYVLLEDQLDVILNAEAMLSDSLTQYRNNLENFRYKLEEVLYRLDVTPYAESSTTLDKQLHKTRQTVSTDDPELDKTIAEVHKIGFIWREKVFRPEEVTIYRYSDSTQNSETSTQNSETIVNDSPSAEKGGNTDG